VVRWGYIPSNELVWAPVGLPRRTSSDIGGRDRRAGTSPIPFVVRNGSAPASGRGVDQGERPGRERRSGGLPEDAHLVVARPPGSQQVIGPNLEGEAWRLWQDLLDRWFLHHGPHPSHDPRDLDQDPIPARCSGQRHRIRELVTGPEASGRLGGHVGSRVQAQAKHDRQWWRIGGRRRSGQDAALGARPTHHEGERPQQQDRRRPAQHRARPRRHPTRPQCGLQAAGV
jgi:hypothetical protein